MCVHISAAEISNYLFILDLAEAYTIFFFSTPTLFFIAFFIVVIVVVIAASIHIHAKLIPLKNIDFRLDSVGDTSAPLKSQQ